MKTKLIIVLTVVLGVFSCTNKETGTSPRNKETNTPEIIFDTSSISLAYLEELHERKTLNKYDNSLTAYIGSSPNIPDSTRKVVYILPFGNMHPEVEEIIKNEVRYLEVFLQISVKVLERVSYDEIKNIKSVKTRLVPDSDYNRYSKMKGEIENLREQIEANSFMMDYLTHHKPKDAVAVLGITEHDIYMPKYNFLFGASRLKQGVGLISTFRLIDYGEATKSNIRKVASKQIVNMFSIGNTKDYSCLLNFHINKAQLEGGEFKMSPKALEKLKYAIGFEYNHRFAQLQEFWENEGSEKMSNYYRQCRATEMSKH